MKYVNAAEVLPEKLLRELQTYVDGELLYISKGFGQKGMGRFQRFAAFLSRAQREDSETFSGRVFREYAGGTVQSCV